LIGPPIKPRNLRQSSRFAAGAGGLLDAPGVKHSITSMIKTITKVGNSQGIMLDAAIMDIARLKVGDQVNLTVHESGSIYLTPVRPEVSPEQASAAIKDILAKNRELFRRLS
jgi:antitoxin component of MazEF toxin-antitoxin module